MDPAGAPAARPRRGAHGPCKAPRAVRFVPDRPRTAKIVKRALHEPARDAAG
jgi:acyl-coenzyme A synthetase/AMP-(fatty) acid ligase